MAGSALERLDGNDWLWVWVGVGGCWWFGLALTGSALEKGDKDGRWIWVWVGVGDCCWFGTAMTGLALEKRVGDGLCWTVDFRSSSSDVGRTLTDSLDCLVCSFFSRARCWAYLLTSGLPEWLLKAGLLVSKGGPVYPTAFSISRNKLAGRLE